MKKVILSWLLSLTIISITSAQYGSERSGYEGDYFSLEGAIDLFKSSRSINDFERKLNSEDSYVNNLDLDYDGRIDYIRVEHRRQGDFHAIILQVPIDRYEVQDVAVIEIEKVGRRNAILQIIGDEDLYGEEVIVEPYDDSNYSSSTRNYNYKNDYVNVYYWPAVQSMFDRDYIVYISPFRWQYYPTWWSPWNQYSWNVYRPRIKIYHRHYHVVHVHRVINVHHFYKPYRSYCNKVVVHSNTIRVKHGKKPIYRTEKSYYNNERNYNDGNRNLSKHDRNQVEAPRGRSNVNENGTGRNVTPNVRKDAQVRSSNNAGRTPTTEIRKAQEPRNNNQTSSSRINQSQTNNKVPSRKESPNVQRNSQKQNSNNKSKVLSSENNKRSQTRNHEMTSKGQAQSSRNSVSKPSVKSNNRQEQKTAPVQKSRSNSNSGIQNRTQRSAPATNSRSTNVQKQKSNVNNKKSAPTRQQSTNSKKSKSKRGGIE